MSASKVPVSVIIVNYKTKDLTIKALTALFASSVLPQQVILVDNNSQDGSLDAIREKFPDIEYIVNIDNVGFAKANNQAIREKVTQPYIWLLNSDTETGMNSLAQLYLYLENHPKIGAVSPQLVYPTRAYQSVGGYFPSIINIFTYLIPITTVLPKRWRFRLKSIALYPQPIPKEGILLDYVTGAASLLRKKALDQVGLLAEDYFMYFEETDLCFRLRNAGWSCVVIDADPVMHVYGGSFKTKYDPRRLEIFLVSLKIFIKKNYHGFRKTFMLLEIFCFGKISLWMKQFKNII